MAMVWKHLGQVEIAKLSKRSSADRLVVKGMTDGGKLLFDSKSL